MGLFRKIANALKKTKEAFSRKMDALLSHGELDDEFYDDLTDVLISCDIGVKISFDIVEKLRLYARKNKIRKAEEVKNALKEILVEEFETLPKIEIKYPCIITIIGVNGVGKTTTIGKLAKYFKDQKKEVTLVAGDTLIKHEEGADAAAVVFDGITSAKAKKTDVLIVDTAGRLHTKSNLMQELNKIDRVIEREYSEANRYAFIVLDATTGQNALTQIEAFNEVMSLDGIVLTKLDGTAKGGVVVAIEKDYHLPVAFVGVGEGIDDLVPFDAKEFVDDLF